MPETEFTFLGDAVWLDFINTARGRLSSPPDLLPDPAALERWTRSQNIEWIKDAGPSFAEVLAFRARLTALAEALHENLQPPTASITAINEQLAGNGGHHQLTRISGEWQLRFAPDRQPSLLQTIASSAAEGLADALLFVRRCAGQSCSLFFTDNSPNQSRRWCSAAVCGRQVTVERRRGLLR
jgi:predicted RNA-binding Zn ribbon-like protein